MGGENGLRRRKCIGSQVVGTNKVRGHSLHWRYFNRIKVRDHGGRTGLMIQVHGGTTGDSKTTNGDKKEGCHFQARRVPQHPEGMQAKLNGPRKLAKEVVNHSHPKVVQLVGDLLLPKWCKPFKTKVSPTQQPLRGRGSTT
jgi:hypothetical protein